MDYLSEVIEAIKPIMKDYGYKKKALNWYTEDDEIVKIFNLQKSLYGKQIYINAGVFIKAIEAKVSYLSYQCHIQARLDGLIKHNFLDFENPVSMDKRKEAFINLIKSNPYKFFTTKGSKDEIKNFIIESKTLMIFQNAKDYLKID